MSKIAFVLKTSIFKQAKKATSPQDLIIPDYIQLVAKALLKRGHQVDVYNNAATEIVCDNICHKPLHKNPVNNFADLVVVHNGAHDLVHFTFRKAAVWQHNRTSFVKAWKRGELLALWRFKPDLICLSHDAINKTPRWMPYNTKQLIPHAIQDEYLNSSRPPLAQRKLRAFFASRPSRK